ncbi:MAG: class I SAM-dependent methyltransferase [Nitrosomonas sp.]|nr:class I SAM-dependent methyltransferase [Nitrosomonas sp.]
MRFEKRDHCPSCNGTTFTELHRTAYDAHGLQSFLTAYYSAVPPGRLQEVLNGGTFSIVECGGCGLIFQHMLPSDAILAEIYGNWLGRNDPLAPSKPPMPLDYYTYMAQEIMQLIAFLQKRHGRDRRLRFLDYGMSWGNWVLMAQKFGVEVFGVEKSPIKCAYAQSRGIKVLSVEELSRYSFDFISMEQVVEHLSFPRQTVLTMKDALASGGIIKISVPDGSHMKSVLRSWTWDGAIAQKDKIMPLHPLEHLNCFTPLSLQKFAKGCELKPVSLPLGLVYAYSTDWSNPRAVAKNLLRPIKRFVLHKGCNELFERM